MSKLPPYQLAGFLGSAIVILYLLLVDRLQLVADGGFLRGLVYGAVGAVVLATLIELGKLVVDYRAGYLFPLRNATFFVVVASLLFLPPFMGYTYATGGSFQRATLLLLPVFLFFAVRNLFRVRIDNISLSAKVGFGAPLHVPLFKIGRVEADKRRIEIATEDGRRIELLRSFFFADHWRRLRERLASL